MYTLAMWLMTTLHIWYRTIHIYTYEKIAWQVTSDRQVWLRLIVAAHLESVSEGLQFLGILQDQRCDYTHTFFRSVHIYTCIWSQWAENCNEEYVRPFSTGHAMRKQNVYKRLSGSNSVVVYREYIVALKKGKCSTEEVWRQGEG